ncbi:MAG: Ig-like domain-containing protein [Chloroflexota bacterium]
MYSSRFKPQRRHPLILAMVSMVLLVLLNGFSTAAAQSGLTEPDNVKQMEHSYDTVDLGATKNEDVTSPTVLALAPTDEATNVALNQNLIIEFDENVAAGTGNMTLFKGTPQELFNDPLDDASQLTVTTGNFGVNLDFGPPYTHFGVNDGAGGGDYGGDTPSARVDYNGFSGGYLEAYGLASLTNPSVVEWQNIDITGATNLQFSADFASALQPDIPDSVTIEAIIDGGTPEQILLFNSSANNSVFRLDGTAIELTDTAQNFQASITGTGNSLTIRARLSLSASTSSGDDIAIDNVIVTGSGLGTSTLVEQVTASDANVSIVDNTLTFNPTANLDVLTNYYVTMDAGTVTDASVNANEFKGILDSEWNFTTGNDAIAPIILMLDPAEDAVDVVTMPTLSITFDETVQTGTGNITIHQTSDDAVVATFDVTADISLLTTTETNDTIQFAPGSPLAESTEYYVLIPVGAIQDVATVPNDFAGISSLTAWSFTVAEPDVEYLIFLPFVVTSSNPD